MFVDCDFLYLGDIKELFDLADDKYAVMCVQIIYPRKNWSSMVLYNCGHLKNKVLSPEVVNKESKEFLTHFNFINKYNNN
ncbi:putative nucleotide-diphospho-sugar transferase [Helianthus debilis subsp. tardiflorus]